MSINTLKNGIPCLTIAGKYGSPNGLGEHILGWTQLGDQNDFAGYYQRRANKKGTTFTRCRPYWNPPHTTERALAVKNNFSAGVFAWHALTTEQKNYYNTLKKPHAQTGFTRFMSQWLKENQV